MVLLFWMGNGGSLASGVSYVFSVSTPASRTYRHLVIPG